MATSRSNILLPSKASHDRVDELPLLEMLFERALAILLERVIFAFAAIIDLHPAGFDKAFGFHAMKDGIEHAISPFELLFGAGPDFLDDGVAVALAFFE